jgi:hypothetical protein
MFYTLDTENCRPLQNSNRQESRYSHEPNSAVHRDAGEKREAASIDRLKLVLETSAGNRLRSPASLSSAAWPDPSGKQRPTTRNRLKNNSSKIGLKQKTLAVLNPRCLTKAPRARCGEGRRAPRPSSESMMTVPSAAVPAVSAAPPVPAPPAIIAMPPRPIVASPAVAVVARVVAVVRVARIIVIAPVSKCSRGHHR